MVLHSATPDGLVSQVGHQERSGRGPKLVGLGRRSLRRIERDVRPPVEFGEIRTQAPPRVGLRRIDRAKLDHRRGDQPLDREHRDDELGAVTVIQRGEDRSRELVAALVEQRSLGRPGGREAGESDPRVHRARGQLHQPVALERAQQPAGLTRIEPQPRPQRAHLAALGADLPEHSRSAERAVSGEILVAERAHALGHHAVEPPDQCDARLGRHSLT